jgi:hypothetical protein
MLPTVKPRVVIQLRERNGFLLMALALLMEATKIIEQSFHKERFGLYNACVDVAFVGVSVLIVWYFKKGLREFS